MSSTDKHPLDLRVTRVVMGERRASGIADLIVEFALAVSQPQVQLCPIQIGGETSSICHKNLVRPMTFLKADGLEAPLILPLGLANTNYGCQVSAIQKPAPP
jgi:hypothetical protein